MSVPLMNYYYEELDRQLAKAVLAGKNLAVSPLLGDMLEGFGYKFVQCEGVYPEPGWTTYHAADMPVAVSLKLVDDEVTG